MEPRVVPLAYNVVDAARVVGLSPAAIRQLIWRRTLPVVHIGRRVMVRHADLERLLAIRQAS